MQKQFPVCQYLAIIVNKLQEKFLQTIGLDLRDAFFTYRQLYVALCRATNKAKLTVELLERIKKKTANIVYSKMSEHMIILDLKWLFL